MGKRSEQYDSVAVSGRKRRKLSSQCVAVWSRRSPRVGLGSSLRRAPEYVQRVDPTPLHMTAKRKLALVMGKLTAEDSVNALQNSHCIPELESVQVSA